MKKAYLKTYKEYPFNQLVGINVDMHEGKLTIISLNDGDIGNIRNNLLADEHIELHEKEIRAIGSTDLTTVKKFIRSSSNSYIYVVIEQKNKFTVDGGDNKIYIKEVAR